MELLIVTLAHTTSGRDADGLIRVRLISETIRNAPGLVNARFYRSKEPDSYYFLLTTWEDEDFWQKAQERYSPKNLLVGSTGELLMAPPEQWVMKYLWGYSRPSAEANIAAAHLVNVRTDAVDRVQRAWIEGLRRLAVQPTLAFAFLARVRNEDTGLQEPSPALVNVAIGKRENKIDTSVEASSSVFLNLLSWQGETHRKEFYADQDYKAIHGFLSSVGVVRVLALDPL